MRDVADTFGRMKGTSMGKLLSALFNALTYSFFLRLFLGTAMFCGRLKRRKHFWINMTACFTAYFLIVNLFLPINVHGVFARTVLCVGWFLVALLWLLACFDEPIPILLFCSLAGYTTQQLAGSVNVLTVSFLQNIGVSTYPPQFDDPVLSWLSLQLIHIVVYLCVYGVVVTKLKTRDLLLERNQLIVLSAICLFADVVLQLIAIEGGVLEDDFAVASVVYGYNILSCLFIYYLQFSALSNKHLREEMSALNELWAQQQKQYLLSKETIDNINIKCHDLKHQIRKRARETSLDRTTIKEIENMISIYDSTVKTGNDALDVILTEKSLVCNENGIHVTCIADGTALTFMRDADIYTLFGNALDNAIEAVLKLEDKSKRVVGIRIKTNENYIVIHVYNYYSGSVEFVEGRPKTSKCDIENHGFGIKSIMNIVEKYGGNMHIQTDDSVFNLSIVFQKQ